MSDFIVVGAGLAGLLTARELRATGAAVTIVEHGAVGRQASWAGGGILSPLYPWTYPDAVNTLVAASQRLWPDLCEALRVASGIDPECEASGLLVLDEVAIECGVQWASAAGVTAQVIDATTRPSAMSGITFPHARALSLPHVKQVRNPRLLAALRQSVVQSGVRIVEHDPVTALRVERGRVQGVTTASATYNSAAVVITAGAWTAELLRQYGVSLAIRPVRGQMLLLRAAPGLFGPIVLYEGHYLIARRDGRVLVGSTMEEVGFECRTTDAARVELLAYARRLVPVLADAPIEQHWAGLRPGSPSGIPYIGALPCLAGLYVNAGHFRNGVVMGPASARLVVDLMLARSPLVDPRPYQPPS